MNTALTTFTLAILLGVASFSAQSAEPQSTAATLTRADVRTEFLRARAAGELPSSADVYGPALAQAMNQSAFSAQRQNAALKTPDAVPARLTAATAASAAR